MVGDQAGGAFQQRVHDFEAVRGQGAAGLGAFDDGVYQIGDFDFGRAPAKLDVGRNAVLFEVALGDVDQFGRDALALQVAAGRRMGELFGTASTQR